MSGSTLVRGSGKVAAVVAMAILAVSCSHATPASTGPSSSGTASPSPGATKTEAPVAVESNPPGDIPDSQVYVAYIASAGHFSIKVPEGWTRATAASTVSFSGKLNTVSLSWKPASSAPTVQSVQSNDVPQLKRTQRAFQFVSIKSVSLPAGPAVLLSFRANSAPNDVTGKQYRDEVLWYALYHNGTEVIVQLISPVGADNVDPWRIVSKSIQWQ
jgi:hypothetical protein